MESVGSAERHERKIYVRRRADRRHLLCVAPPTRRRSAGEVAGATLGASESGARLHHERPLHVGSEGRFSFEIGGLQRVWSRLSHEGYVSALIVDMCSVWRRRLGGDPPARSPAPHSAQARAAHDCITSVRSEIGGLHHVEPAVPRGTCQLALDTFERTSHHVSSVTGSLTPQPVANIRYA